MAAISESYVKGRRAVGGRWDGVGTGMRQGLPGTSRQNQAGKKNQPGNSGNLVATMPALQQVGGIEFLLLAA